MRFFSRLKKAAGAARRTFAAEWKAERPTTPAVKRKAERPKRKPPTAMGKAFKRFTGLAIIVAIFIGGSKVLQGLAIALLVVAGVFITISAIPGMDRFATSKIGYPCMVLGTAILVHYIVGAGTLAALIATAFTLTVKMVVLDAIIKQTEGEWNLLGRILVGPKEGTPPPIDLKWPLGWHKYVPARS
jgi:hypothetical protein